MHGRGAQTEGGSRTAGKGQVGVGESLTRLFKSPTAVICSFVLNSV